MSPEPQTESATPPAPPPPDSPPSPTSNNNASASNEPPRNELKRKTPPMASLEPDTPVDRKPIILPPGAQVPVGEYEAGRVICEVCGGGVSFRDDAGGAFTLKHWEAHRLTCGQQHPGQHPPPHPNGNGNGQYTPPGSISANPASDAAAAAHLNSLYAQGGPPAKRRRAKRTEEERIEYLRADVHVAQFEAYRVLCASCDKWIRLRPNSTYCSIPWDAHRKSCLAKKSNAKNIYALEERNAAFAKDPDVRKFDAERILCGMCDKWLSIPVDDHPGAVQIWLQHRSTCQKTVSALKNVIANASAAAMASAMNAETEDRKPVISSSSSASAGPSHRPLRPASPGRGQGHPQSHPPPPQGHPHPQSAPHPSQRHPASHPPPSHVHPLSHPPPPTHLPHPDAPHLLLDLSPTNYAAPHESRRRNAESSAPRPSARTSSSASQRRAQKANEISSIKASKRPAASVSAHGIEDGQPARPSEDGDEPESEEGVSADPRRHAQSHRRHGHPAPPSHPPRAIPAGYAAAASARPTLNHNPWQQHHQQGPHGNGSGTPGQGDDMDAEGEADDVDADGDSYMEEEGATPTRGYAVNGSNGANGGGYNGGSASAILRRAVPASLADLDSPGGRRAFIFASVEYLFRTTYEASDDMSVSALLTYLNAAMPTDKHEDFDTGEVVRAASALAAREKERYVLEGDMLRLLSQESG
ncbi:hypothetical protein MVEN_02259300 [Mycena venus]|uniref:Uncharacterized protein n=1 Tax=Mycena venus TaxID=2733690 RepID=A0A8H6X5Y2_9AGAR|nr:hypothetical protein MVEN_02259300 [Mycena venus]